jgi:hypothetical protein
LHNVSITEYILGYASFENVGTEEIWKKIASWRGGGGGSFVPGFSHLRKIKITKRAILREKTWPKGGNGIKLIFYVINVPGK